MFSTKIKRIFTTAVGIALFLPAAAFAGESWSAVSVDQWQAGGHTNYQSSGSQSASIDTYTKLGDSAGASSHSEGSQSTKIWDGTFSQKQQLSAASGLDWSGSYVTADTSGGVTQQQTATSHALFDQTAGINQYSHVGNNESGAQSTATQHMLSDPFQKQSIVGATHSEGKVFNPFQSIGQTFSNIGGQLVQTITVTAQNVLNF